MRATRALLATTGALALCFAGATSASAADTYQIQLAPLNDSGAAGTAVLTTEGNQLTVEVNATGLLPGQPHAQHVHGDTDLDQDYMCPTPAADADGDGVVSTAEGLPDYGDIFISLTTSGDTSKESGLAVDRMPAADANGNLSYSRTIEVDQATLDAIQNLHVVQHGIDRNGNGEYDVDGAGVSELDPALPQEATAPASCGMIVGSNIKALPEGGVQTGGGDTSGTESAGLAAVGGASLVAAAGGIALLRRRRVTVER